MVAAPSAPVRDVDLGGGRRLVVRPVGADDVDGLAALYGELDDEARYRRFFSAYRPGPQFFAHLVAVEDRGGAELVAVARGPGPVARLVGEAGYELLPNGNGELAIVVSDAWRGWLGPFLLDALLEVAAGRGVPNLEADILASNLPMLALAQARGSASMARPDWTMQRVVIGAATREPGWPVRHDRPRVLVEGGGVQWHAEPEATAAGLEVLACSGPSGRRRCPVLDGRPCPLVAGADVVVLDQPPDDEAWEELRRAHPDLHPGVPVCVEARRSDRPRPGEDVLPDVPAPELVALVARRARPGPDDEPEPGGEGGQASTQGQ